MQQGWRVVFWGVALVILSGLVVLMYLERRLDEEIRSQVQTLLSDLYPKLDVEVRSARIVQDRGIAISGIVLKQPNLHGPQSELLTIDEMTIECDAGLQKLLTGPLEIRRLVIQGPRLRVVRNADGRWNWRKVIPRPTPIPIMHLEGDVENGVIEVIDRTKSPPTLYTLRDIDLAFEREILELPASASTTPPGGASQPRPPHPQRGERRPAEGENLAADDHDDDDADDDDEPPARWEVAGRMMGDHLRDATFALRYDGREETAKLHGSATGFDISPELLAVLPAEWSQSLSPSLSLRARIEAEFDVAWRGTAPEPWLFAVQTKIARGRVEHPQLPYPLAEVQGDVEFNNRGVRVNRLVGRNGSTMLRLSGGVQGYSLRDPADWEIHGRQVMVDHQIFQVLPLQWQESWSKILPQGVIDIDGRVVFDGRRWTPDIQVSLLNASFQYENFRYRLDRAAGAIVLSGDRMKFDVTAYARADKLRLHGELNNAGPDFTGYVQVDAATLRFDQDLLAALPEQAQEVVESFNPSGECELHARFWRDPGNPQLRKRLLVGLRGAMRYDRFAYPLYNLRGWIEVQDEEWRFRDLTAANDSTRLTGEGWLSAPGAGHELVLRIQASDVPLERELHDALGEDLRRMWGELNPRGRVDLEVEIRYQLDQKKLGLGVVLRPRGDGTSIQPLAFPWRVEKLRGTIRYQDGNLRLENLAGEHGATTIALQGQGEVAPHGGWQLETKIDVDRLVADRNLIRAAPESLREKLLELELTNPVNISGTFGVRQDGDPQRSPEFSWDATAFLHRNSIRAGTPLTNIYGSVQLQGTWTDGRLNSHGELDLDSLSIRELQLTEIRGPIWIENDRVLLGAPLAQQIEPRQHRHVSARLCDGQIFGDFWLLRDSDGLRHGLRASLYGADLRTFALESVRGPQNYSGKIDALFHLSGGPEGARSLSGAGKVQLRDARVYELPQMVALLKVARFQPPDVSAFTTADADFRIQAEHIYFDKINFNGDAISLVGSGEIGFDKQVRLTFRSSAGREGDPQIPIISQLIGGATQQLLMINVTGPLDKPDIVSEPLPAVSQALQQLGQDLQQGNPAGLRRPPSLPGASPANSTSPPSEGRSLRGPLFK